jgi:dephospho-CoA kinase
MLRIGLTGGIGSGKSTVAQLFELLGIPVYYADDAAKELMNTDEQLKNSIKKNFGAQAYKNNLLDRQYMATVVFNDPEKLKFISASCHIKRRRTMDAAANYSIRHQRGSITI